MKQYLLLGALFFAALFIFDLNDSEAEPWLGVRYAQNCAACHSPSRRNVEPSQRRCTLACQGCHVNPNGGGLRNEYGVWNQQRWLRSSKMTFFGHKGTPAPLKFQKYGNMPDNLTPGQSSRTKDDSQISKNENKSKKSKDKTAKNNSKENKKTDKKNRKPQSSENVAWVHWEEMAEDGAPLVVTAGVDYNEDDYDKEDQQEHITVQSRTEQLARMTEDDPWRLERKRSVTAGGDFRYFYLDGSYKENGVAAAEYKGALFPMTLDLGVRVRPTPEKLQFVFENRYFNGPTPEAAPGSEHQSSFEKVFNGSQVRSGYMMIDDLPYATYIMYGLYRPMFGHYNPDHTSLLNTLLTSDNRNTGGDPYNVVNGSSAKMLHKAITIGGSPNVPFFNLHYIMPTDEENYLAGYPYSRDKGWAFSAGGRFVSFGAYFMFSMWKTKGPRAPGGEELASNLMSLTGGGTFGRFIANFDYTTLEREFAPSSTDSGTVTTVEMKYRLWREMYAQLNWATSNVSRNLKNGDSTETLIGMKWFALPGTEFEFSMVDKEDNNKDTGDQTKTKLTQAQMHLYF